MGAQVVADDADGSDSGQLHGIDALPDSNEEIWEKSPLGKPSDWPDTLKAFSTFITTLPHPSAVLWGEDLILICNDAWKNAADGAARQGAPQKGVLAEQALSILRTVMLGKPRQNLHAELFLNNKAQDGVKYQAILSPLMQQEDMANGVSIQLLHMSQEQEQKKAQEDTILQKVQKALRGEAGNKLNVIGGNNPLDKLPLDENPFFQRFASMLPTGMAILNHKAEAVFVNEQFFELTTSAGSNFTAWPQSIHPDDYDRVMNAYQECFQNPGKTLRVEFRTIGPEEIWRLLLVSPLEPSRMNDASIEKYGGFVCAVIDITPNKSQELAQRRAAQEALERKEQQERFIDMISHEIRNPLSAILHCAEEILEIIELREESKSENSDSKDSTIAESAETIKLCVTHQKNIVDDILSFSKLDASMLSLCPRSVQPKRQLADSLKMFQPEFRKQHLELEYIIDRSYEEMSVDWVKADLVRISQILVNLVTNAIKFTTRKDGERKITTMVGASIERPTSYPPNVVFFDSEDTGFRMDGTNTSDWGNGQALYIMVAVKDTGIGISDENQKKLFQRFRQATPKTEESYGGSGLGLMISRKLCQLHGGEIGVSSKEGIGSTFGFFFRVRKVEDDTKSPTRKDRLGSQDLVDHMHKITKGNAPLEHVAKEDAFESLKHPQVEHTEAANDTVQGDEKWKNTSEIASHVREPEADEYGQKSNPSSLTPDSGRRQHPSTLEKMQRRTDSDIQKKKDKGANSQLKAAHVLLVEDNVINQRILKRKLESKHFKVTTANDGREAVDAIEKQSSQTDAEGDGRFDVVLMDQEMPVLDGNAATKQIRQLEDAERAAKIPILGVTANVRDEQKADMIESGMDDVISKPYSMDDLIGRIEGLLEHKKADAG